MRLRIRQKIRQGKEEKLIDAYDSYADGLIEMYGKLNDEFIEKHLKIQPDSPDSPSD